MPRGVQALSSIPYQQQHFRRTHGSSGGGVEGGRRVHTKIHTRTHAHIYRKTENNMHPIRSCDPYEEDCFFWQTEKQKNSSRSHVSQLISICMESDCVSFALGAELSNLLNLLNSSPLQQREPDVLILYSLPFFVAMYVVPSFRSPPVREALGLCDASRPFFSAHGCGRCCCL